MAGGRWRRRRSSNLPATAYGRPPRYATSYGERRAIQDLYFEDLAVGMRETFVKTVKNEDVIGFAELSGDHNPIIFPSISRARRGSAAASCTGFTRRA